jgi:hypothetical protein
MTNTRKTLCFYIENGRRILCGLVYTYAHEACIYKNNDTLWTSRGHSRGFPSRKAYFLKLRAEGRADKITDTGKKLAIL